MRIDDIRLLEDKFEKKDFDLEEYLKNARRFFKDELIFMKLKITYLYAKRFREVRWTNNEKISDFIEDEYLIYEASCYGLSM